MTNFVRLGQTGLKMASFFLGLVSVVFAQSVTTFDVPNSTSTIPQSNNLLGQIAGYYQDPSFGMHGFLRQANGNIITFDANGSTDTKATGINDLGLITGSYLGADGPYHGFLRKGNGTIMSFDAPNSPFPPNPDLCEWRTINTWPEAINLLGQITGMHQQRLVGITPEVVCAALRFQGFLRQPNGAIVSFGITVGTGGELHLVAPKALNLPGQITGDSQATDLGGPIGGFVRQANGSVTQFLADEVAGNITFPASINLFGQIAGSHRSQDYNNNFRGFLRRQNGSIVTFAVTGSPDTEASSINDVGQITGYYLGPDNAYHGFLRQWNGSTFTFEAPGAATGGLGGTFPQAINLFGQVTGYYQDSNFVLHGFVRNPH
jgi:uncharacterized membrane protein